MRATLKFQLLAMSAGLVVAMCGCGGGLGQDQGKPTQFHLTVTPSGSGSVTSAPAGINCGTTCSASFPAGTSITLTAAPSPSNSFAGWSGACSGAGNCTLVLNADMNVGATFVTPGMISISLAGPGSGTVISKPAGIDCGQTCSTVFKAGTTVKLTAAPASDSSFAGWSGACSGTGACSINAGTPASVTATFKRNGSLQAINHIIFMLQENRSFDHYFGALRQYWADNGYPDQPFDGLPQFPISAPAGPAPTNPGCDPAFPWNPAAPVDCTINANSPAVASYHLTTMCLENPSPSWNPSHVDFNLHDPVSGTPTLDGFVWTAAHDARNQTPTAFFDTNGLRAMGYYDGNDLNYYYFMASNFATSDRWFSPVMTRTPPNRMYLLAGTSHGLVHSLNTSGSAQLPDPIIFQVLQQKGISWKIYVHPDGTGCSTTQCLYQQSYIQNFTYGNFIKNNFPQNIAPISEYLTDVQNGTLPAVAMIEPASDVSLDEHPSDFDVPNPPNIQKGALYVQSLIDALMLSPSWKDSAFILTFDEFGGLYDHVPPQPTVNPDGIPPTDLQPGDICTTTTGPTCDFTYTGYRVPLIVVSPFAKKNYVSHTVADFTAILKLIETRFNLAPLTRRDAAQMDMTEFFDLVNMPWQIPPVPPQQNTTGACYLDHLP